MSRSVRALGKATRIDAVPCPAGSTLASADTSMRVDEIAALSHVRARSHFVSAATSARAYPSRNATYELKLLTVTSTVRAPFRDMAARARRTSDDLPYRRGEIRNTFWPAARSRTNRSSSATRLTNADAGTTSP